ncbi:MAG: enoyl-CoA hydratase [Rhodospirillaceae bacterium]|jgi:2-(1,2-epoxy-1,2-dihydrophenyl)acetyl-CoA isomerase|nr:enoyl-CoA hydratase [Rhodospirillaceae bacterium]MBT3493715.1 enoyl-CoA hydratase [Rhodospirillaceae bacterium]MBT3778368.1 enoyl-CoA hydratase [Rhodospirillaceae bacterium]MBT3977318.1 enoyl-CoA hydratase [Rhodospirillaceae bacterium]MBT4169774.1 enoyl-CoA hydratase [Rhodospirillaceae bacterium]
MADCEMTIDSGIATMTMNRPEARNALSMEMRSEMDRLFHEAEFDDAIRCIVLEGAGDHFMAGGDVKNMHEYLGSHGPAETQAYFLHRIHALHTIMFSMRRMPKPIVAKVRGAAAGAGVSVAAACDLVMAEESAFFTLAYCNIGTTPDGSSSFHLPRAIGIKRTLEMTLLGDRYSAQQMADMGLVNFVVPNADLDAECGKLAARLANGPTHVYGMGKKLMYRSLENEFESQLQMEAECFADCAKRNDYREGVAAFVEKRKPNFTGT